LAKGLAETDRVMTAFGRMQLFRCIADSSLVSAFKLFADMQASMKLCYDPGALPRRSGR
jgi:hypothetical protein